MSEKPFWAALLLLLVLGGFFLGFSGSVDDAHITFWAANILGSEGEILNYNFDRIEQSSALLQVLILACLYWLSGISVLVLGHVTTAMAAMLALFLTGKVARDILPCAQNAALWLLASSPFFVYWSFSGMESPVLACLLLLLLMQVDRWLQKQEGAAVLGLVSLSAQMARPEVPLVLCIFALTLFPVRYVLTVSQWRLRAIGQFLVLQIFCAVMLTAWRWWYFHDIYPQPVSAKIGGSFGASLQQGLQYIQETWCDPFLLLAGVLALAGAGWVIIRSRNSLALLLVMLVLPYSAFVVGSGGDWMAAGRFWVPIMPLAAILMALALQQMFTRQWIRQAILLSIIAGNIIYLWRGTAIDFNGVPLWKKTWLTQADNVDNYSFFERHAREHLHDIPTLSYVRPLVEKLLAARNAEGNRAPVNLMAGQMGMVPFYLATDAGRHLHFVDRNGIVERTLTHCSVADGLPRTRNGIGTGYAWIVEQRTLLESQCGLMMPDIIFDIETGWNRHNIQALQTAGYVFVYRQRGHIFDEPPDTWLPLRKIGAGQFIAVSPTVWEQLGRPQPVERIF